MSHKNVLFQIQESPLQMKFVPNRERNVLFQEEYGKDQVYFFTHTLHFVPNQVKDVPNQLENVPNQNMDF